MQVQSHLPQIETQPLTLRFFLNGIETGAFSLARYGWVGIEIQTPDAASSNRKEIERFELEIRADRVWQPNQFDPQSTDDRELSVAVCNLEICP